MHFPSPGLQAQLMSLMDLASATEHSRLGSAPSAYCYRVSETCQKTHTAYRFAGNPGAIGDTLLDTTSCDLTTSPETINSLYIHFVGLARPGQSNSILACSARVSPHVCPAPARGAHGKVPSVQHTTVRELVRHRKGTSGYFLFAAWSSRRRQLLFPISSGLVASRTQLFTLFTLAPCARGNGGWSAAVLLAAPRHSISDRTS